MYIWCYDKNEVINKMQNIDYRVSVQKTISIIINGVELFFELFIAEQGILHLKNNLIYS